MPLNRQQLSALGIGSMSAVGAIATVRKSRRKPGQHRHYIQAEPAVNLGSVSAAVGIAPPVAKNVTYERILEARSEPQNWLTYYGAYDGQRYSPLDQINTENVERLRPAWVFQFGSIGVHAGQSTYAFEAAPIVVDGVMYVSGWDGWVWAIDARTGQELWRYRHEIPFDTPLCCGNVNRGVAVTKGKVFVVTLNAHVIALDAETGRRVWDQAYGDVRAGESATVAPLVVKDLVIVGSSGGELGVRGHLDAFNVDTGKRVWRTYTVPKPGEPGSETWPAEGDAWARGGGNCWVTGTYDAELNLMYWGTGNPSPDFDGSVREGDNLYTDCVLALDPDNGEIRWHYQYTPHDVWDYDSNMTNILFELDGRKLLAHFDKNGYFFVLDRTNGEVVRVAPFGERITWGEIDADGKVTPKLYPEKEAEPVHVWPAPGGATEWTHTAYSPRTQLFYVPVIDVGATLTLRHVEFRESLPYYGGDPAVDKDMQGFVKAFDPSTGEEVWRWRNETPMVASVLATGGDLVFAGEPSGEFNAFHAWTGELLWQFQCGSGHHSSPTTYSVDGTQHIAVPVGWGSWVEGFAPEMVGAPRGNALFAFALSQ
jgi:alcohol dehydrogenase (cytochrome c)